MAYAGFTFSKVFDPSQWPKFIAALTAGFKAVEADISALAFSVLASIKVSATQSINSTSYVAVTGLTSTFTSKGGPILFLGTVNYRIATANSISFGLFVDGVEEMNSGSGQSGHGTLAGFKALAAGSHTIAVKARVDGGTATINGNISGVDISSLYVGELSI